MRAAAGVTMIGLGALLIYGGIRNQSVWYILLSAISPDSIPEEVTEGASAVGSASVPLPGSPDSEEGNGGLISV